MKEKFSLMRKAYNFKQNQWLDPTIPSDFCLSKSWVQAKPMVGPNKVLRTFLLEQKLGAKNRIYILQNKFVKERKI